MKEKGLLPFVAVGAGAFIVILLAIIALFIINQTIKITNTAILLVLGLILLYVSISITDLNFRKQITYLALVLVAGGLLLGSVFVIIGTPFLIQPVSINYQPTCAFARCYDPINEKMEGPYGISGVFSQTFGETSLGADYDVRAVTCEFPVNWDNGNNYVLGANSQTNDFILVSQIQTTDGAWIDYYFGHLDNGIWTQTQVRYVDKVDSAFTSENIWISQNTGGTRMDLTEGQRFITNKVRCRITSSYEIPLYGGGIEIKKGSLKVFGDVVIPTCFDGIKNQDEIEIDCGGVCEPCSTNPDVCGDEVCTGTETQASCPLDCSSGEPQDPEDCGEGMHYETIEGQEICVADLVPANSFWIVMVLGLLGTLIALYLAFVRK